MPDCRYTGAATLDTLPTVDPTNLARVLKFILQCHDFPFIHQLLLLAIVARVAANLKAVFSASAA
eukprot:1161696-Pelagomonas_calceolata.AAC.48